MSKNIKELINQIIKEELTIATQDGTSSTATSDQKLAATAEMNKGGSVNFVKKGASLNEDEELDEMARIATYVKKGDETAFAEALKRYAGTWVEDMLTAVAESEKGLTQPEMVTAAGKQRQQDINPYVRKLQASGALVLGDPSKEKIARDTVPGALGRRPTEAGEKAKLAKMLLAKFIENPEFTPSDELVKVLTADGIAQVKALAAKGGPSRGRPMAASTSVPPIKEGEIDEMARIATYIKKGDQAAWDEAKKRYAGTWVEDMLDAVEASDKGLTQPEMVSAAGKQRQQDINPYVRKLQATGALVLGDPSKEKIVKDTVPGALGRRPTEDGQKAKLSKELLAKFLENPDYEPKPELIDFLGQDQIDQVKATAAAGGPKRGRKMGGGAQSLGENEELDEMARIPTLYQIDSLDALNQLTPKVQGSKWVQGIIKYIEDNGPSKIIDIATNQFNVRQQGINPVVQSLVNAGVLSPVAGSADPVPQYKKDGTLKQTTQQKAKAKPDAEDYFIGNHNALGNDDNDEEVEHDFTGGGSSDAVDDEFASEDEPKIDDKSLEKATKPANQMSDEEYNSFMDYLKYSEQLAKLKAAQTKNKKIGKSGDDLKGNANDEQGRIAALKDKLQDKVDALVAGSPFLQKRVAKETGVEYVPPVVDDVDKESGADDEEELDEISLNLNEGISERFKVLARIK